MCPLGAAGSEGRRRRISARLTHANASTNHITPIRSPMTLRGPAVDRTIVWATNTKTDKPMERSQIGRR